MHQAADDDRNLELFRFMSEVDRVKPGYVILENVPGFKDEKMNETFVSGVSTKSFASLSMDLLVQQELVSLLVVLNKSAE